VVGSVVLLLLRGVVARKSLCGGVLVKKVRERLFIFMWLWAPLFQ
jgi:hypothetical protein